MESLPTWLAEQYPFAPRRFTTPHGAEMSYVDEGQGSHAVLMVHGNPTWSFYYRELVRELSPHVRCIVPDHVGMGLSDKPADYPYTLAARIADLEALVDSLGVETLDLVVHDWGGAIGFGLAGRCPGRIRRIVILNTAAFTSIHLSKRIAICKAPLIGPLIVRGGNGFAWPATWMAMSRRALSAAQAKAYLFPYDSWAHRVAVSAFVQDIPMKESHPSWKTLRHVEEGLEQFQRHPTLLLWGGRDFCFNDHFYNEWIQRLPQAEQVYLDDAGHYVLEDAPNDAIPRIKEHLLKV